MQDQPIYQPNAPRTKPEESAFVRLLNDTRTLKEFDLYAKVDEDATVQTSSGAILSIGGWIIILLLILSELSVYISRPKSEHLVVDTSLLRKLNVEIDVSFHALTCAEVHLDSMDVAGYNQVDLEHDIVKRRLSQDGSFIGDPVSTHMGTVVKENLKAVPVNYCGSCYGAENQNIKCCNTCDDLKQAYKLKGWSTTQILRNSSQCLRDSHNPFSQVESGEGCRIRGVMSVNKIAGNFHVAHGESIVRDGRHIHQYNPREAPSFNVSHTIHKVAFGDDFRGMEVGPLDNLERIVARDLGTGLFQYYIKVVPTVFTDAFGRQVHTNTYTMTERFRPLSIKSGSPEAVLPGVFFIYDISPFMRQISRRGSSFFHMLSRLFAIVGGIHTLIGVIDTVLYRAEKFVKGRR